jgi:hypothetical protein
VAGSDLDCKNQHFRPDNITREVRWQHPREVPWQWPEGLSGRSREVRRQNREVRWETWRGGLVPRQRGRLVFCERCAGNLSEVRWQSLGGKLFCVNRLPDATVSTAS